MNKQVSLEGRASRAFVVAIAAVALGMSLMLPAPAFANDADDLSSLVAQAKEVKERVSAASSEYLAAVQHSEEAAKEKANAEARLAEIGDELDAEKEKLGQLASEMYKMGSGGAYLDALLGSGSFQELLANVDYLRRLAAERQKSVDRVAELEFEAAELPEKLEEQSAMALEQAGLAEDAKAAFDEELAGVKESMKPLQDAMAARVASTTGQAQIEEILTYLESVGDDTETQAAIVRSAYRMTGAGGYTNLCESWAENCVRSAGLSMPRYIGAWQNCKENMVSSDWSEAKIGCFAWGSGSGGPGVLYGHIGVIVYADGNPEHLRICDSVSAAGTSQTLAEWAKWQTAVNYETGQSGLFGWGYPPGYSW